MGCCILEGIDAEFRIRVVIWFADHAHLEGIGFWKALVFLVRVGLWYEHSPSSKRDPRKARPAKLVQDECRSTPVL